MLVKSRDEAVDGIRSAYFDLFSIIVSNKPHGYVFTPNEDARFITVASMKLYKERTTEIAERDKRLQIGEGDYLDLAIETYKLYINRIYKKEAASPL